MNRQILALFIVVIICVPLIGGCGRSAGESNPSREIGPVTVLPLSNSETVRVERSEQVISSPELWRVVAWNGPRLIALWSGHEIEKGSHVRVCRVVSAANTTNDARTEVDVPCG